MEDIFQRTQKDFTQMEYAEGLFFQKGLASPTIRIQAPSIAMVFTDGPALGADLEGSLFFNDIKNLGLASYVLSEARDVDLRYYAQVEFFSGLNPKPFAVFLASDRHRIVDLLLNNGTPLYGNGQWTKLDIGCSTALMEKKASSMTVTITAQSIRMKATFFANNHFSSAEFSIRGNLAFEAISKISGGTTAGSSLDDRIYFSPAGTTDFKAFFMPFTDAGRIGMDRNTYLGTVTWSTI